MAEARSNASMMSLTRLSVAIFCLSLSLSRAGSAQTMQLPEPVGMAGDPAAQSVLDGNSAFLRGDLRRASDDYHAALRRKPDFAVAFFDLGLVEIHQDQRSRGLADMDHGITLAIRHGMSASYVARLRALRSAFNEQPQTT